jgi:hypothetical protein
MGSGQYSFILEGMVSGKKVFYWKAWCLGKKYFIGRHGVWEKIILFECMVSGKESILLEGYWKAWCLGKKYFIGRHGVY